MSTLSLYIHIPFCARKCRYCDFYSVIYDKFLADSYIDALAKEISLLGKNGVIKDRPAVQTVYFGGGTPSALLPGQLKRLCDLVRGNFALAPGLEWTVECNPESFSQDKAQVLLDSGVTRLTFGIQSLSDRELSLLGRVHNSARSKEVLADPVLSRFASVGIDLMYGLPGQSFGSIEDTLNSVFKSPGVKHVSAYELTIAVNTPFGRHRSLLPLPGDSEMSELTARLWELLGKNGFEQYEVSNFAKTGHDCRHNQAYWDHKPYLGLGCAAHSYLPPQRFGNIKDVEKYSALVASGDLPREFVETVEGKKLALEMLFLGLRRIAGINEETFQAQCGLGFDEFINKDKIALYSDKNLLTFKKPLWKPTKQGLLMADAMARELINAF
jgi:oxygen-independent coproporphyrinogen-3 oxidase